MRKYILLVVFLGLTGCAYFEERMDAVAACAGDPVCLEKAVNYGKAGKAVGDATGFAFAGAGAGALATFLAMFFARRKKDGQA
jgi:LPXTG-motif cell wall-anchored protein